MREDPWHVDDLYQGVPTAPYRQRNWLNDLKDLCGLQQIVYAWLLLVAKICVSQTIGSSEYGERTCPKSRDKYRAFDASRSLAVLPASQTRTWMAERHQL
jgi:hypothetical protein